MTRFPQQLDRGFGPKVTLDPHRLVLAFYKPPTRQELSAHLSTYRLLLEPDGSGNDFRAERVGHTSRLFWTHTTAPISEAMCRAIAASAAGLIEWIGPVYQLPGTQGRAGLLTVLPNVLVIEFPAGQVEPVLPANIALRLREVHEKSAWLRGPRYFVATDPTKATAYQLREEILHADPQLRVRFETVPLLSPASAVPNDPMYSQQWNLSYIDAPLGWDITTGDPSVTVCVIDYGCDLTHPDLVARITNQGINTDTMSGTGAPPPPLNSLSYHGTASSGIAVASSNNSIGITGVAGKCSLLPIAVGMWSDVQIPMGINWAVTKGAQVISMSWGLPQGLWSETNFHAAFQYATTADVVLCAATGNDNGGPIHYPACDPMVMAIGASDMLDNLAWFSNIGPELSVVAPGTGMVTTDIQGSDGASSGDYDPGFIGTSAATPHVGGLAGLLRSAYPALAAPQIRRVIERSAERVGNISYFDTPGYPNGTWNSSMGYGRINLFRALDFADVIIRDSASDDGTEPSTNPSFWELSDIVVRPTDDGVFVPSDPIQSRQVELGQDNFMYVQVTNMGPADARNVEVSARILPFVGLWFVYPDDWTTTDSTHVAPTPITSNFASIPAGGTAMAKFRIDATQVTTLFGWDANNQWHPCAVAMVTSDNDYAFGLALSSGEPAVRRNNLAQRNLTVVDHLLELHATFHFVAGSLYDLGSTMAVTIDRSALPKAAVVTLALDADGKIFPRVRFDAHARPTKVSAKGGKLGEHGGKRFVVIEEPRGRVDLGKQAGRLYPMSLDIALPAGAKKGTQFPIRVLQHDGQGRIVGGATAIYVAT